jgi:hypothetical protein
MSNAAAADTVKMPPNSQKRLKVELLVDPEQQHEKDHQAPEAKKTGGRSVGGSGLKNRRIRCRQGTIRP